MRGLRLRQSGDSRLRPYNHNASWLLKFGKTPPLPGKGAGRKNRERGGLHPCLLSRVGGDATLLALRGDIPVSPPTDQSGKTQSGATEVVYWRVEGSLLDLSAVRAVAFFTWNAHSFIERWVRRGSLAVLTVLRPLFFVADRVFATRLIHILLRGVSQDRLDLLGEEYFQYVIKPRLKPCGVEELQQLVATGARVVLVSQGLEHVMRPLAAHLGVRHLVSNRLEFRDGMATGRLLEPVIRPRGDLAYFTERKPDGRVARKQLARGLGFHGAETLDAAVRRSERRLPERVRARVLFDSEKRVPRLSVREALRGKHILLVGVTGFIGKVWLESLLTRVPEIGRIYLLIRRKRKETAARRFERIVAESPVFDPLYERHGDGLGRFLGERIEVVEGDVAQPGLGLDAETRARLGRTLDLVVNSSGLTDFNPDLREALTTNVDAALHLLDFVRASDHAALLHLSTCYVAGARDGRVAEEIVPHYTPAGVREFHAEREYRALGELIRDVVARAESPEFTEELRRQAIAKHKGPEFSREALEQHVRRYRARWLRTHLTEAGTERARQFGWPNTYTFSKSLAESLMLSRGAELPVAVVRPSIVETSLEQPFRGWNEGINTSAPLSYLLGTYFRQLPTNKRKRLDLIPVDVVCRGMTLVAAALVTRRHQRCYQLATSIDSPCDMRRAIELTSLAHRKHYRALVGLRAWLRSRFDAIPVSKTRFRLIGAPQQKAAMRLASRALPLPGLREKLQRRERDLVRVEKLIELYEPFILHNEHVFEAGHVALLSHALPAEERESFGYDATAVDWWEYWINVHVPALRRWVYPLIEGRQPLARRRGVRLEAPAAAVPRDETTAAAGP